jgi:RNA polymerase sigma factor (sigma-70 family)
MTASPTTSPPEIRLVRVETYQAFFRREYPGMVTLAWTLTGSRETAEDVAQDALLALYRRWDDLDEIVSPRAFARRICANLAVSNIRRRVAEAKALARLGARAVIEGPGDDDAEVFWSEVRALPRRQAQVVALFYGCDLSVMDVAETLGMTTGTVKVHLSRARTTLATRLGTTVNDEEGSR